MPKQFMTLVLHTGIVAGVWPCGTITMLAELYGAETKAQVYETLHTFLQQNKDSTNELRELYRTEVLNMTG